MMISDSGYGLIVDMIDHNDFRSEKRWALL